MRAVVAAGLVLLSMPGGAQAAKICPKPDYPGSGYYQYLTVTGASCAEATKQVSAYTRCRRRDGLDGRCQGKVRGYRCHEKRESIPTEFDGRVVCTKDGARVVHYYQQNVSGVASVARAPACFGAAARDAVHPCSNPALRLAALPGARSALLTPNAPCAPTEVIGDTARLASGSLVVCEFGTPAARATRTVALLGDSHAMAWRAAVAGMLKQYHWHGIDLLRSHCAFSSAVKHLPRADAVGCRRHNVRVRDWLTAHPVVSAVVTAHQSGGSPFVRFRGLSNFQTQVAGFASAWSALPPSVTQVFAIRDNPDMASAEATAACVRRARSHGRAPGRACSEPRSQALLRDPFAEAVRRLRSPRYAVASLTRFFCGPRRCFPVVGGALVYKDGHHLSRVFSESLGPYLARRVGAILIASAG